MQLEHDDAYYMGLALVEARKAMALGEVPIGAVLVRRGEVVAAAHNWRELAPDPTGHAEMLVIREAARRLGGWRLTESTLYVTIEPCPMCAGAIVQARIERLVYGAADPKAGAVDSLMDLVRHPGLNHQVEVTAGVRAEECQELMKEFFRKLRLNKQKDARV
ncbi:tRNA(adenine34) deaminase [Carboxydocella sporoproducens DSM 16521]|uniref:tRNA-specific adenosine deaminase n=2 Tax=Carboxydocella TaxID=178898 RepID=A0A1T4MIP6_9FIRM|nr:MULTISPECIES: tRNA adenosine(34) deaminase TadA [Carboxydocella]AVX21340.1 tRNA(adenine34) deaminase [Carboxydocella thermautotrophica]SJZ66725.1 tRNA(adenine34) deaminase [Carboxydocella sporoproducens DSM 16521]